MLSAKYYYYRVYTIPIIVIIITTIAFKGIFSNTAVQDEVFVNSHNTDNLQQKYRHYNYDIELLFGADSNALMMTKAIQENNIPEVLKMIREGKGNINAIGQGGVTPFVLAYYTYDPIFIHQLLELGGDPNVRITETYLKKPDDNLLVKMPIVKGRTFFSALLFEQQMLFFSKTGRTSDYASTCFDLFLVFGADSNTYDGMSGKTILFEACEIGTFQPFVEQLIRFGADIDFQTDEYGMNQTPVLATKNPIQVLCLLNAGCNYTHRDARGKTLAYNVVERIKMTENKVLYNADQWQKVHNWLLGKGVDFSVEEKRYQEFESRKKPGMSDREIYELEKEILGATYDFDKREEFETRVQTLKKDVSGVMPDYDDYVKLRQEMYGVPKITPRQSIMQPLKKINRNE